MTVDLGLTKNYRIMNVYRVFNPENGLTQKEYFINQLKLMKDALVNLGQRIPIILGDFNLDENKHYKVDYSHRAYYELLDPILE